MTKKNKNKIIGNAEKLQEMVEVIDALISEEQRVLDSLEPRQRILNNREEILDRNIASMTGAKGCIIDAIEDLSRVLEN